jgi:tetratricopeptide (TPR) repeat protein
MAQRLLGLCGMSDSVVNLAIMITQAEVHRHKSEYSEAWKIHSNVVQISADRDAYYHAVALLNVAEVEVLMGLPKHDVQQKIDHVRSTFTAGVWFPAVCDTILGDLCFRDKDLHTAQLLFEKCLRLDFGAEMKLFCLERLANTSQWGTNYAMWQWTTIFLVYSLRCEQTLQVHKALQFFGDTFLCQNDEDTAISLFSVALEGFTYMDVHRSRAECMLRLGDILKNHGDILKAVELWSTARPLFERSSQAKQVQCVDERLACISNDVLEQYRENITHVVELNVLSGGLSPIGEEQVGVVDEPPEQVVV